MAYEAERNAMTRPGFPHATIRKLLCTGTATLLLAVIAAWTLPAPAEAGSPVAGPLILAGSSGHLAVVKRLAEAFARVHPEITIHVPPSLGSGGAIRAAADGAIAIGLVSRPLEEEEKGLGLTVLPYARTALVIGAHPSVADDGVTFEDLVAILHGTKPRWKDGHEIIVITRNPGSSTFEILGWTIPGFQRAFAESYRARRWTSALTDQEMDRLIASTPYAIGFTNLGVITVERLPIKALKVNGVAPTSENIRRGRYPLVKPLAFVFVEAKLPAGARLFLEFARSREGEKVLRANAYVPSE